MSQSSAVLPDPLIHSARFASANRTAYIEGILAARVGLHSAAAWERGRKEAFSRSRRDIGAMIISWAFFFGNTPMQTQVEAARATDRAVSRPGADHSRAIAQSGRRSGRDDRSTADLRLTGSHALLVGVPGLAKTLMVKALAAVFQWKFNRIQFTPDLMPADITGYELLGRLVDGEGPSMVFRRGPVFANLVLADEINRAAPKTQSALLEAMAERHVTVGGQTLRLGRAVRGHRDAKPDRAGRDLSVAGGAVGSLHDGNPHRLSHAAAGA